jgi:4-carboxymuconolactone decarboxylase
MKKHLTLLLGGLLMMTCLTGTVQAGAKDDPDFYKTTNRLIYEDIYKNKKVGLAPKTREMVTLANLIVNYNEELVKEHTSLALQVGLTPIEIKETMYQAAPYVGVSRVYTALDKVNEVMKEKGVKLPVVSQTMVTEANRLQKGIDVQTAIFGDVIPKMRAAAPENQNALQDYLSGYCFGDTYTRTGLNIKARELITFTVIAALGGCEGQLKSHTAANLREGASADDLIDTLVVCMPYNGFPRTLNALACVNEVAK